jgi:putative Mn2+ efflux pump MntP
VVLSIATSIDAVAVGVSLALLAIAPQKALFTIAATALATAAASYIGLAFGKALGRRIGKAANIAGGIILILIGVKILFEHLMQ